MKPTSVIQVLRWLRMSDTRLATISLFEFFCMAYSHEFKVRNEAKVGQDVALFAQTGQIPFYLLWYMRRQVFPLLVKHNPKPEQKLLT